MREKYRHVILIHFGLTKKCNDERYLTTTRIEWVQEKSKKKKSTQFWVEIKPKQKKKYNKTWKSNKCWLKHNAMERENRLTYKMKQQKDIPMNNHSKPTHEEKQQQPTIS